MFCSVLSRFVVRVLGHISKFETAAVGGGRIGGREDLS